MWHQMERGKGEDHPGHLKDGECVEGWQNWEQEETKS